MLQDRISRARTLMAERELDACIVQSLPNVRYLTGFTGSDGLLLLTMESVFLLVDGRYDSQASEEAPGAAVIRYRSKLDGVVERIAAIRPGRVGFEIEVTTVSFRDALAERIDGLRLVPLRYELDDLRSRKDPSEVALIRTAARIAGDSLAEVLPLIGEGRSEADLAVELEYRIRRNGAEKIAFDTIVASGPRGALPHGTASRKTIEAGEAVTIDFGAVVEGYHSDETVTVARGRLAEPMRTIHRVVLEAHDRAIEALRPGVPLKEVDSVARDYISACGYGDHFGHGLGHGVGLEIHERPTLNPRAEGVVEEGMVVTVEPGIYVPGLGGVRIEDTLLVTADGCERLTSFPKGLIEL